MTGAAIVAAARAALGTPFRHQGRRVGQGLDCAGLVVHVCDVLGVCYVDQTGYSRRPSGGMLESALDGQPGMVQVSGNPQYGDVLLMRFSGEPQHLAIFAGENIIHSYLQAGKVCEHRYTALWKARTVCIYRFVEVTA